MRRMRRWIVPILVLPGTALVFVPLALIWLSRNSKMAPELAPFSSIAFWIALPLALLGVLFAHGSAFEFFRHGEGTAAPWDPPQRLVIFGPYRHVRNPMISGVLMLLVAESLFLKSWLLAGWALMFYFGNALYLPLVEEKGLKKRFGESYTRYCQHVRRWIPRLRPWHGNP